METTFGFRVRIDLRRFVNNSFFQINAITNGRIKQSKTKVINLKKLSIGPRGKMNLKAHSLNANATNNTMTPADRLSVKTFIVRTALVQATGYGLTLIAL